MALRTTWGCDNLVCGSGGNGGGGGVGAGGGVGGSVVTRAAKNGFVEEGVAVGHVFCVVVAR